MTFFYPSLWIRKVVTFCSLCDMNHRLFLSVHPPCWPVSVAVAVAVAKKRASSSSQPQSEGSLSRESGTGDRGYIWQGYGTGIGTRGLGDSRNSRCCELENSGSSDRDRSAGTLSLIDWKTERLKDWTTVQTPLSWVWIWSPSWSWRRLGDTVVSLYPSDLHLHLKPLLKLKLYLKPKLKRWCSSFFGFRGPGNWFAIPWGALILIDHDRRAIRSLVGAFPSQFLWVYGPPSIKPPSDFIF